MTATLSVRTHFSLSESLINPSRLGELAKEHGYDAVGITDIMNINGLIDMTKSCKKNGVKPIIGCRIMIYDDPLFKETKAAAKIAESPNVYWIAKLYAKNEAGIKAIIKLLAKANQEDHFYYHPRSGLDDLSEVISSGDVILLTGDLSGLFSHKLYGDIAAQVFAACAHTDAYIELVPSKTPLYDSVNRIAYDYAEEHGIRTVVSAPMLYESNDDAEALDVMSAITNKVLITSPFSRKQYLRDQSFKSASEVKKMAYDMVDRLSFEKSVIDKAMLEVESIVAKCTYEWKQLDVSLPKMADDESAELMKQIKAGWVKRFSKPVLGYKPPPELMNVYKERLRYEVGILRKMGFERYFLLVSDIVTWSKDNGVIVGPGRGSASGSLVSYLLGITDLDPIRFKLIFERFINPSRLDLPDVDLDFASSKRHEVIEYITDRFGVENVAGISNYVNLGSASGIRDVGRAHGLMPFDMNCTKLMPKEHGESMDIDMAADAVPEIERFSKANPIIWKNARKLVGTLRNYGRHAAGVVIAGEAIVNRAVVEKRSGEMVVNWDKNSVEQWGLIKVDILGLSTLDVLDIAKNSIKERLGTDIEFLDIPLDDEKTLISLSEGKTTGIFQLESCLSGDSVIDGITIKDRYLNQTVGEEIRCFDDKTGELSIGRVGKIVASGRKRVFLVTLSDGRSVKMTEDHKVYTDGAWHKLKHINIGDKIAGVRYQIPI